MEIRKTPGKISITAILISQETAIAAQRGKEFLLCRLAERPETAATNSRSVLLHQSQRGTRTTGLLAALPALPEPPLYFNPLL
jgi:hypothetical protein